jgi:hypothetical protein
MGEIHHLIATHGAEAARAMASTKGERQAVDAAATIMAEEAFRLGVTHAGFAMTSLPHKRIADPVWRREGAMTTLLVEAGRNESGASMGVPYGSFARLVLLYLQTEAIRTGSPEVELGRSMNAWLGRMSLSAGGETYRRVSEQAKRISACRLTFFTDLGGAQHRRNGAFVRDAISLSGVMNEAQPSLWQDKVRLDDGFWASLRAHPVPVREEAIRAIGTRSMALDVLVWISYRLHALNKPTPLSWTAVHGQFGAGVKAVRHLKPVFLDALRLALAVYPEARVDVLEEGLMLHPSPPAVPKAEARRIGIA